VTGTDIQACLAASRRQNAEGCVKTTEDLARYREVIQETRPERVIEIGTFSGRSAVWLAAEILKANPRAATGPPPTVFTVDVDQHNIDEETWMAGHALGVWHAKGRSIDRHITQTAQVWAEGHRTMVVLDGDHSEATVFAELGLYAPLVSVGCYCVVEDTLVRHMPDQMRPDGPYYGNPADAVDAWLPKHPGWTVDLDLEHRHGQTQFPGGWLRRDR
jgi:cephalosporin hydroxylase